MFDWIADLTTGIGESITTGLTDAWDTVTSTIWDVFLRWVYEAVFKAIGDFFTMMAGMGTELFDLPWIQSFLRLFSLFGWALFAAGLVIAVFDTAIEYQSMRQINIKTQILPIIYSFLAVSLFTTVPIRLYNFCITIQNVFSHDIAGVMAGHMAATNSIGAFAYEDLTNNLGGCYIDLMTGEYIINPLEPKAWADETTGSDEDDSAPEAFRKSTRLSQHISYLKDFFRSYKDFTDAHIDAIEILVTDLYAKFGISDRTDYGRLRSVDYPVMADLYTLAESEYHKYAEGSKSLFTEDLLREICLGLNSMCKGAESKFFNGHTNITDDKFICFGVKGLMDSNKKLKDGMYHYCQKEILRNETGFL